MVDFLDDPRASLEAAAARIGNDTVRGLVQQALLETDIPNTVTRTSFGFTLNAVLGGRAVPIGAVLGFDNDETRTLEDVFEVELSSRGLPIDIVPQNVTGRTLTVERYDLFSKVIEEVFQASPSEIVSLADQLRPFVLREVWRDPGSALTSRSRLYQYTRCWFSRKGRRMKSTDNRIVMASGTISYQQKVKVIG